MIELRSQPWGDTLHPFNPHSPCTLHKAHGNRRELSSQGWSGESEKQNCRRMAQRTEPINKAQGTCRTEDDNVIPARGVSSLAPEAHSKRILHRENAQA